MELIDCIICGHGKSEPLFNSKSFIFPSEIFSLVKCVNCGFVFLNPRPTIEEIGKYYQNYHLHIDTSRLNWFVKQILLNETIGHTRYKTASKNNKFLEIGFGDGLFLEYMKKKKWDVYGIEIGDDCIERMKNIGIENVYNGDIFSSSFDDEKFDLVRMNHTLEHMHDPLKVLMEVKRILKKGGKLIIAVPNFNGGCHKLFKQYAYSLHLPFHLYFFSLSTLESLINKIGGLKIIRVHKNHSLILYLASIIQFLKRNENADSPSYNFSTANLIMHRLIGLIATPFMNILNLFIEGDNLEVEIIKG